MDADQKEQIALFLASLPIPYRLWAAVETLASISQGKGWGASSVSHEVRVASHFLASPPRCIVDVGANVGDYIQSWIEFAGDALECHLFEPSHVNVEQLRARFADQSSVHLYPCALSDVSAVLPLYANVPGSALGSLSPRNLGYLSIDLSLREDVRVERFDHLVSSGLVDIPPTGVIDVLKIDVEGHELAVLRGMGEWISRVRIVQFEFSEASLDAHCRFQDFWRFFERNRFALYRVTPRGFVPIPRYLGSLENFRICNYLAVREHTL